VRDSSDCPVSSRSECRGMVRHARIRTVAIECLSTGRGAGEVCEQDDRANVRSNPLPGGAGTHAPSNPCVALRPDHAPHSAALGIFRSRCTWPGPRPLVRTPPSLPSGYADRHFAQSGTRTRAPSGLGEAQRSRAIASPTERAKGWHGNTPHVVGRCRSASTARDAVAALRGAVGSSGRGMKAWPAHVHVRGRAGRRF
jgi:hypothetical protein